MARYGLQKPVFPQPLLIIGAMANVESRQSPCAANQIWIVTSRLPRFSKRYPGSSQVTTTALHASPTHSLASGARPADTSSGVARRTLWSGLTIGAVSADAAATVGRAGGDAAGCCALEEERHAESPQISTHAQRERMDRLEQRLAGRGDFIRVRRSALVNVRAVATLERYAKGMYTLRLTSGATVTSSRYHQAALRELIKNQSR